MTLALRNMADLSAADLDRVAHLHVSERQAFLGKSFAESVADWWGAAGGALGDVFELADAPVGLVLFRDRGDGVAIVHGLKIATPYQGRGLAHHGFGRALAALSSRWPHIERVELTVHTVNRPAREVYERAGMTVVPGGGTDDVRYAIVLHDG